MIRRFETDFLLSLSSFERTWNPPIVFLASLANSFAKNFHMEITKKPFSTRIYSCRWRFFDVAKVHQLTHRNAHSHTSVVSRECFFGIPESLFKKVQLNSTTLAVPKAWFCISKWLLYSPQPEGERKVFSARNSSYFVCSSLSCLNFFKLLFWKQSTQTKLWSYMKSYQTDHSFGSFSQTAKLLFHS